MSKLLDYRGRLRASAAMFLGAAAVLIVGAASPALAKGVPYEIVYNFAGGSDGASPANNLVKDAANNLYGMTAFGGANNAGTVFEITPSGTETVLYSFPAGSFAGPGSLLIDSTGNLYGATNGGGADGYGFVFKLAPGGAETTLYSFTGGNDGGSPFAGLIADAKGNLYGTTSTGGAYGDGNVFEIAPDGTESVLHDFSWSDGAVPGSTLKKVGSTLYGMTSEGGADAIGTVFDLTRGKKGVWTETVLYSFPGLQGGSYPYGSLTRDTVGNLYGTTASGGANNMGSVLELAPDGTETALYSFCVDNQCSDGTSPNAGLYRNASTGNLYGTTTQYGGGGGTVFKVAPNGTMTVLHAFTGGTDGAYPYGTDPLVKVGPYLYGTTSAGGASGNGTVFKVKL